MSDLTSIVWELLYGEEFDRIPDPNKPENTAHLSAMAKAEREKMRVFVEGSGKVLFDRWKNQIRTQMAGLVSGRFEENCNCATCWEVRKIKNIFELVLEAQVLLTENRKD